MAAERVMKPCSFRVTGPSWLIPWLFILIVCNLLGWALSAVHFLTGVGYAIGFLLAGIAWVILRLPLAFECDLKKLRRRFSRILPFSFLVLAILAFIGGALYAPTNYDALAYRTPRVLHWLADHRWHWIHTEFPRLNVRGCEFEWVSAPLLAWFKTDRLFFLINFISFCFLPGLFFSVFRRLGAASRTAYAWMWIFPGMYGLLLQAGSIGNDMFAAFLVLAAIHFGLQAAQDQNLSSLWLSVICAGLFTGVKANNFPLLLVCAVILLPAWRLVVSRPLAMVFALVIGGIVSFAPIAVMNQLKTGDWTGGKAENMNFKSNAPLWVRPAGNLIIIGAHTFLPPIAPFAKYWNENVWKKILPARLDAEINSAFMTGDAVLRVPELEVEESAGLGLGVGGLIVISTLFALLKRRDSVTPRPRRFTMQTTLIALAVLIAFGAFLEVSSVASTARLGMTYCPLVAFPLLLLPGQELVARTRVFRTFAVLAAALAAVLILLSPERPLVPVKTMLAFAGEHGFSNALVARAERVYSVYSARADAFRPALEVLPPGVKVLGMITFDDPETAMWRPFGSRRVVHVCITDGPTELREKRIQYIWVHPYTYERLWGEPFQQWLQNIGGEVVIEAKLNLRASEPEETWKLVKLD